MKAELHVENNMAKQVVLTCSPVEYLTILKAVEHMTDIKETDIKDGKDILNALSNPEKIVF